MSKLDWGLLAIAIAMLFGIVFCISGDEAETETEVKTEVVFVYPDSKFNTDSLESWCGEPVGTLRMIGAANHDGAHLVDEAGNLWRFDTDLPLNAWCLLWIDDMGTPDMVEDDEVVKVWVEYGCHHD